MPGSAAAIASAIEAAFKDTKNSLGPNITKSTVTPGAPGTPTTVVPVTGVTFVDPKLAKAIAGAVADGIAKFLP